MDEIRGSQPRRLSQILDPIARLASDLGSNSAPCSPRLGARHDCVGGGTSAEGSPRLLPRRTRQGPTPPPRPQNSPVHGPPSRDSPYANVPSNSPVFKTRTSEKETPAVGSGQPRDKAKSSPYNFTSEPSGYVEYTEKRTFGAQTDFGQATTTSSGCSFENKVHEQIQSACNRAGRAPFDSGRTYSFSGRSEPIGTPRTGHFAAENRLFGNIERTDSKEKAEPSRAPYAASKSFDGYASTVEELNWQERCLELQLELHRSRSQATRVRDMLRDKVSYIHSLIISNYEDMLQDFFCYLR